MPSRPARDKLGIFIAGDASGGAERYIELFVDALKNESIGVVIVGRLEQPAMPGTARNHIIVGPKWSRRSLIKSLFALFRERRAYLDPASKGSLIGAHLQFKREQILLTKKLARNIPIIWTEHGILPSGIYCRVLNMFYLRAARHAKMILCVSQAIIDNLCSVGVPSSKLWLAENPFDVRRFKPDQASRVETRRALNLCGAEIASLTMSRLDRHQGIHRVFNALRYLLENYAMYIAGSGPAEAELRRQASVFGQRVRFLGFRDDPASLLRAADIFCIPSTAASGEGVPTMAVLEAMATGVPVVATSDSGLDPWFPVRGGIVAGDGDRRLAECFEMAAENRAPISAAASNTAQDYDIRAWQSRQRITIADLSVVSRRPRRPQDGTGRIRYLTAAYALADKFLCNCIEPASESCYP